MSEWMQCESSKSPDLLGSSVFVSVSGWLADTAYSLNYENRTKEPLKDVRFVFPVDDSSAVYRLEAELNGRTIECECREKAEAESAYRAAVDRGLSAAFAAESDDSSDLMNFYLGNVSPGGQVNIRMRSLVALEAPERWVAALTIPRVLVPRYRPESGGEKPPKRAEAGAVATAAPWLPGLRLRGCVSGGSAQLRQLRCSQGRLLWQHGREQFSVTELSPDCDIELTVEFEAPASGASVMREAGDGGDTELLRQEAAALTCFFDDSQLHSASETPKEFVIVVDRSGSMGRNKITAAKEALLLFLKSLPRGCRFNIVSFGSSFDKLFSSSQLYSEARLKEALALQARMGADMGGTEILKPLQWVFDNRCEECQARVILLTDGEVSNVDQVKDLVLKSCSDGRGSRTFAIGIGHGASTSLVKGVARVGRGRADFVRDGDSGQLRRSVIGLLKAAQLPCVEELQVSAFTPDGVSVLLGTVPSYLTAAPLTPLSAFLMLRPEAAGQSVSVTVRVTIGGRDVTIVSDAAPPTQSKDAEVASSKYAEAETSEDAKSATSKDAESATSKDAESATSNDAVIEEGDEEPRPDSMLVHRAAARLQLKEWADENSSGQHTRSIVALSLAANLVSACTAFVGIDRESGEPLPAILKPVRSKQYARQFRSLCTLGCDFAPGQLKARQQSFKLQARQPQASACMGAPPAAAAQRSDSWFSFRLPSFSLNSWGKKSGSPDASKNLTNPTGSSAKSADSPAGSSAVGDSAVGSSAVGSSAVDSSGSPGGNAVLRIAASQQFDGSWEVSDDLLSLLSVTRTEVEVAVPNGEPLSAWFTALVCGHLKLRLTGRRAEWELLADKAREFLTAACRCRTAAQLMAEAEALISQRSSST